MNMLKRLDELAFKGTTTVGAISKEGVILASDTRVTMGSLVVHKKGKKVYKIDDHLAMTISGVVADAQKTVATLKANAQMYRLQRKISMPVSAAARLVANLFFSHRLFPFMAQIIIGGIDSSGPHLFSIDPFGSITEEKYVATGSGSPIAYGILEEKFKEDLPLEEALPIVGQALRSAMRRDVATGDNLDIIVIDKNGYRELSVEEKSRILEAL
ncbi:TPA: archaeal proteasome endopeptidase complex subunit beta [Candidatus Bathyarchaeota archaeon]|nr:archaeal proteasome endopeptidase complex subunit beta [Candidatus Bathyarchaeota archaeon]